MKNKLIKGLFGLGLGLSLFSATMGVKANVYGGNFVDGGSMSGLTDEENLDVLVGEVDTPVYSVDIAWTSLQFNYKYDNATSSYNWVVTNTCNLLESTESLTLVDLSNSYEKLYTDEYCNVVYDGEITEEALSNQPIYGKTNGGKITITEQSSFGTVTPSIEWNSSKGYEDVKGKVQYEAFVPNEDGGLDEVILDLELDGKTELPNDSRNLGGCVAPAQGNEICLSRYYLYFSLTTDASAGKLTPKTGDTIGQITLSFKANE